MTPVVLAVLLSAASPKNDLAHGVFFSEAFAEAVRAGKLDPLTHASFREPSVTFDAKGQVHIDWGQEDGTFPYNVTGKPPNLRLMLGSGMVQKPVSWTWLGPDRARTGVLSGGQEEVLVRLEHDYDWIVDDLGRRFDDSHRAELAGTYKDGTGTLVLKGNDGSLDGKPMSARVFACLDGCDDPPKRTVCLQLKPAQGDLLYFLTRRSQSGTVLKLAAIPGVCTRGGPAFEPLDGGRELLRSTR